jgi:GNAT superfamily N-acetyltransferase
VVWRETLEVFQRAYAGSEKSMLPSVNEATRYALFATRLARSGELQELVAIDDAASALYSEAGLGVLLEPDHPFVLAETSRWARAIAAGLAHVAVDPEDSPIGFMTLGFVDGAPYLDQLSVRPQAMRRGVGRALVAQALSWSAPRPLWLTTYSHLAWNRPFYERCGFVVVPEHECGPELRSILKDQRAALPAPEQRIAMVCRRARSPNE